MAEVITGYDPETGRSLVLHSVQSVATLPPTLESSSRYFVAMLLWDATDISAATITDLARKLIDSGCVYLCCWGDDCQRVHDWLQSYHCVRVWQRSTNCQTCRDLQ